MPDVDVLLEAAADVGEAPVWLGDGRLLWVDITQGEIHVTDTVGGNDRLIARLPEMVGAAVPHRNGGYVAATERGFLAVTDDGTWSILAEVEADVPGNRMNDGKCDAAGRFWAGTMAFDLTAEAGALYRLDPDGVVTKRVDRVTLSNGLGWSPDGARMYFVDSALGTVDMFDFDPATGAHQSRRRFVDVETEQQDSMPDGLAVDAEGGVWVAIWGDGRIQRYTPDGQPDTTVRLPVSQVTSCAFGGDDLRSLYVTSAAYELEDDQRDRQPLAGALFVVDPGVAGLPPTDFADSG